MTPPVVVFTAVGCGFCQRAKALLSAAGHPFRAVDVAEYPAPYAASAAATACPTVPLIFVGREFVGGYDDLAAIGEADLARRIAAATSLDPPPHLCGLDDAPVVEAGADVRPPLPDPSSFTALRECDVALPDGTTASSCGALMRRMSHPVSGVHRVSKGFLCWRKPAVCSGASVSRWLLRGAREAGQPLEKAQVAAGECVGLLVRCGALLPPDCDIVEDTRARAAREDCHRSEPEDGAESWSALHSAEFRLRSDFATPALNAHVVFRRGRDRSAPEAAAALRRAMGDVIAHYTDKDGLVDYLAVKQDPVFWALGDATSELQAVDMAAMDPAARMAFGINCYNLAVLHATAVHGPPSPSLLSLHRFFNGPGYVLGGRHYTLNELENGVLRGNRKAVGAFSVPFAAHDPRLPCALPQVDHRIHFALNCGAKSCPPVKVFSHDPATLDRELTAAAAAFVQATTAWDAASRTLRLSRIVSWYNIDFGPTDAAVVEALLPHMAEDMRREIAACGPGNVKLRYDEYDWGSNAKP